MMSRYCLDCDEEIPARRLAAVPNAKYCVLCQRSHEDPVVAVHNRPARPDEIDAADFRPTPLSRAWMTTIDDVPDTE